MKKILLTLIIGVFIVSGCTKSGPEIDNIVCSNTLVASLAHDLLPGFEIISLVPFDVNPDNYKIKAEDYSKINSKSLVIIQPFQQEVAYETVKRNKDAKVAVIETADTSIPWNYLKALDEMAVVLKSNMPDKTDEITRKISNVNFEIKRGISMHAKRLKIIMDSKSGAVVSSYHKALVESFKIEVLAEFNSKTTGDELKSIIAKAKKADFIAGDLSGGDNGVDEKVAKATGLPLIKLNNYPEPEGQNSRFFKIWNHNLLAVQGIVEKK